MQSSTLMLRKRLNRELEEQRKLADDAEASRFTELRNYLEMRLGEIELSVKASVEESGTTLSAYIGELEDRLEKKLD